MQKNSQNLENQKKKTPKGKPIDLKQLNEPEKTPEAEAKEAVPDLPEASNDTGKDTVSETVADDDKAAEAATDVTNVDIEEVPEDFENSILERILQIETMQAEQRDIGKAISGVKATLKGDGIPASAVQFVLTIRKKDPDVLANYVQDIQVLLGAIGMQLGFDFEQAVLEDNSDTPDPSEAAASA